MKVGACFSWFRMWSTNRLLWIWWWNPRIPHK